MFYWKHFQNIINRIYILLSADVAYIPKIQHKTLKQNKMNLLQEIATKNSESKIDLTGLSLDELNKVFADANRLIRDKEYQDKLKRKEKARTDLKVGDIVSVVANKFKCEIWEVLKLNPKKVQCKRENGEVWNIDYSAIKIID